MGVLESAMVTANSSSANRHERDAEVTSDEASHTYYLRPGTPLCVSFPKSVSGVWSMFFAEFDPDNILTLYYDRWCENPNSKYHEIIGSMRSSGASDIMIRDHIKETWRSAGNAASIEVIILYHIVLYSIQTFALIM